VTLSRAKLAYFGSALALVVGVQATAQIVQLEDGFRPFSRPPQRVPFSWDMFAIKIERCTVAWDPPLSIEGKSVARWQDRGVPLEFDSVFNDARYYEVAARRGCAYAISHPTTATVACAYSNGEDREHAIACE